MHAYTQVAEWYRVGIANFLHFLCHFSGFLHCQCLICELLWSACTVYSSPTVYRVHQCQWHEEWLINEHPIEHFEQD